MPLHVSSTVVLIIRRSKLYYTASGIITPVAGRPVHRLREEAYGVNALVAGGQRSGAGKQARRPGWGNFCAHKFPHTGRIACCPAPDCRPPATKVSHSIYRHNTCKVSSSWWWACKCPKHVGQIISAISHSVAYTTTRGHTSNFVDKIQASLKYDKNNTYVIRRPRQHSD